MWSGQVFLHVMYLKLLQGNNLLCLPGNWLCSVSLKDLHVTTLNFGLGEQAFVGLTSVCIYPNPQSLGGTLGISGWGCAAGTLEPLAYTRASSAEFCYPILE